jgi:selenophosphate synthetase-related protein
MARRKTRQKRQWKRKIHEDMIIRSGEAQEGDIVIP